MAQKYRMAVITVITILSECRIESICSIEVDLVKQWVTSRHKAANFHKVNRDLIRFSGGGIGRPTGVS